MSVWLSIVLIMLSPVLLPGYIYMEFRTGERNLLKMVKYYFFTSVGRKIK